MFLHNFIKTILVVGGFWIVSIAGEQSLKESSQYISQQASRLPKNSISDVKYLLFTPDYPDTPCYLEANEESLERCPFTSDNPMKILIHGFPVTLSPDHPFFKIKDKFLKLYNFNVIILDWTKYQSSRTIAAFNTLPVGEDLAKLLIFLQTANGVDPETIHLIGHDMGAHLASNTGFQFRNLGRITALDPEAALFEPYTYFPPLFDIDAKSGDTIHASNRATGLDPEAALYDPYTDLHPLDESNANFVDVIHTSNRTTGNGIYDPMANVDFYPNGGEIQPKCQMDEENSGNQKVRECNHNAAILYFLYSIDKNECDFVAFKCDSYSDFLDGRCTNDSSIKNQMGLHATRMVGPSRTSMFFLKTSTSPPYCLQNKAETK